MNEEIDIILSRYFSGEATHKELRILDTWLSDSDENEEQFYQMTLVYQHIGEQYKMPAIDSQRALSQFRAYIHNNSNNKIGLFFRNPITYRIAAAIAILVVTVFGLFFMVNHSLKTVQLVAVNEQQEFTLFENADVTLFSNSEIIYDTKTNNKLHLKGKATFKIDSKTSEGIIVQAGETFIKDIGTIFTVDASAFDKSVTVSVTEGEVLFYTTTNSGVSVKANQTAMYNAEIKQFSIITDPEHIAETGHDDVGALRATPLPDTTPSEQTNDTEHNVEALHTTPSQEIIFQNTSLRDAINLIQTRYGVNIHVQYRQFNEMMLNVSFNPSESIEYVLDIITATISAQWSKQGENYIITSE
jgi:ferric-dicitrate binding protein FerR (iron transport regulator)